MFALEGERTLCPASFSLVTTVTEKQPEREVALFWKLALLSLGNLLCLLFTSAEDPLATDQFLWLRS